MKQFTADEALQEVYRLTPQMAEYDKFISELRWLPYTMFFHPKNYRSEVVNTDQYGFRKSPRNGVNASVADLPNDAPVNLLVGGSNVVGTGASSDARTTSSYLSGITGEPWLNFGSRGYNSMQEALLFLMHQDKLHRINNVVVLSGMNTLTLEGLPDSMATDHGRYYYSYEYDHYMSKYSEDLRARSGEAKAKKTGTLNRLRELLTDHDEEQENPTAKIITDDSVSNEDRIGRAADEIVNALRLWQQLLRPFNARLTFVLQPLSYWAKPTLTAAEQEIFHAIDSCPNNFWRLFAKILDKEVHVPFARAIKQGCDKYGVLFQDMNVLLRESPLQTQDLFVDRVHCNDVGYAEIARIIHKKILA
ncbi:SGNH/GDSL hydrolase family protein [Pseudomonas sp. NA-150]|uniref:SGNH/GDSL hydrolase family protein n=1 Tax=Pseudomonas sp. NA-150 TaxID=3367525 RepID=UPI0037CC18D5